MALDRRSILDAALELIDELGLDGFTMRKLGDRLGTSQMATYRHFADKQAIVDALTDELIEQMRLPPADVDLHDPEARILGFLERTRTVLLAHPSLASSVAARPFNQMPGRESVPDVFVAAGFPPEVAVGAALTMATMALGLVLYETQHVFPAVGSRDENMILADTLRGHAVAPLLETIEGPSLDGDLLARVKAGAWHEAVYEIAIRECYHSLKDRLGSA